MTEFKYSLDKSSKKSICPSCGKRRFVRYINQITNEYLEENYGRCDRETNCGYHNNPKQNECIAIVNIEKIQLIPDYIDALLVKQSLRKYCNNNFVKFLHKYFGKEEVEKCITKYNIGTSKHWEGATIFWQINQIQKVHAGKIILFDLNIGTRVKIPYPHITWVHKKLKHDNFKLEQCFFGLHLTKYLPTTSVATNVETHVETENFTKNTIILPYIIAIVESEKTAIIMSLFLPDYIWLATGSKQNLKLKLLLPLKKYRIILFPDKGEFLDWNKKTIEFQKLGFDISCSSYVEKSTFEIGTDLADIYLYNYDKNQKDKDNSIDYNETEKKIQRLSKLNPQIINLIKTFDLIDDKGNGIRIT